MDIRITIVDENDVVIGADTVASARKQGLRHRIARVFLVNEAGQVLLQRRSTALRDNPGKWDQSVGGHVDEGENYETAAIREAQEELGVTLTAVKSLGKFYVERPTKDKDGVIKRFHTVCIARYDGPLRPSKQEVAEVRWLLPNQIKDWYAAKPEDFTTNFGKAYSLAVPAFANLDYPVKKY